MYYLQSRYYNPTWGRFISADSLVVIGREVLGCNLFAYCLNNPVNYVDDTGNFPWLILGLAVFAIAGFIYGATTDRNLSEELLTKSEDNTMSGFSSAPMPRPGYDGTTAPSPTIEASKPHFEPTATLENTDYSLTTAQRANNILIGTTAGLMVGGAVVFMGGAIACVAGYSSVVVPVLGVTGKQAVAWGMLAYDVFPIFVAPFLGMEIEPLEYPS